MCINKFSREFTFLVRSIFGTCITQKYAMLHQYSHCNSKWLTLWLAQENICNRPGRGSSLSQQQGSHQEMTNYMGQITLWIQYYQKSSCTDITSNHQPLHLTCLSSYYYYYYHHYCCCWDSHHHCHLWSMWWITNWHSSNATTLIFRIISKFHLNCIIKYLQVLHGFSHILQKLMTYILK